MPVYRQTHLPKPVRLTDEEYRRALLKFPKYCHDVVVAYEDNFFLAERRTDKTPSGPWFIGGQVEIFQEVGVSLSKLFRRETTLEIEPHLFIFLTNNRYFFDGSDGGVPHDAICDVFFPLLYPGQIEAIQLDPAEYASSKLVEYDRAKLETIENLLTRQIFLDLYDLYKRRHRR